MLLFTVLEASDNAEMLLFTVFEASDNAEMLLFIVLVHNLQPLTTQKCCYLQYLQPL